MNIGSILCNLSNDLKRTVNKLIKTHKKLAQCGFDRRHMSSCVTLPLPDPSPTSVHHQRRVWRWVNSWWPSRRPANLTWTSCTGCYSPTCTTTSRPFAREAPRPWPALYGRTASRRSRSSWTGDCGPGRGDRGCMIY